MIQFKPIVKEDVPKYWDRIEPLLNKAVKLDADTYGIESLKLALEQGTTYSVWVAYDDEDSRNILGAITTRILKVASGKRGISIDFIGGTRMRDWIDIGHETIENLAKYNNCSFIQGYGRRAWEKYNKFGWKKLHTTYRKDL